MIFRILLAAVHADHPDALVVASRGGVERNVMAAKVPVGSAQWILNERRQANDLVQQEVEEFSYSARNEMEWLNEHMAEIYSSASRMYVGTCPFPRHRIAD